MTAYEKEYKSVTNRIGLSLLLFVAMFNAVQVVSVLLSTLMSYILTPDVSYIFGEIVGIISYLSSFIVPAIVLRAMLKKRNLLEPMHLEFKMPRLMYLLIPAGVAVIFCASYLNSFLLSFLNVDDIYAELVGGGYTPYKPYEILLLLVSTALVPAFCEEFLFRGAILSNLLPYGKGAAIAASSVLFGLMHQNPYQLLYATVAGVVLGYVYVKTKSIWCGTILHFVNNAIAVLQEVLVAGLDESASGVVLTVMFVIIMSLGGVCFVVYLICDSKCQKIKYENGSFGIILEDGDNYVKKPISAKRTLRGFFSGGMIAAVAVLFISTVSLLATLLIFSSMGGVPQ